MLIFSYIRRLGPLIWVQILDFNIFWSIQKYKYFGYVDFVDIFIFFLEGGGGGVGGGGGGHHKTGQVLGVISMLLRQGRRRRSGGTASAGPLFLAEYAFRRVLFSCFGSFYFLL